MQQQISAITLGISDLDAAARFYGDGFGWTPVFRNDEIIFYQMNGLMLGLWLKRPLEEELQTKGLPRTGAFMLAHNVGAKADVAPLMDCLVAAGGSLVRDASEPPPGGWRGHVADPDGHVWEIAWNPAWPIDAEGRVTFGV